jgi:glycosyltransferase involved in cell wall biosynthesis
MRIAYLTSQYPATSHTFIRREVTALRAAGLDIETFSVRPPAASELKSERDRDEASRTYTLLRQPLRAFLLAHLGELARRPSRYLRTLVLALRHRAPGVKAALLAIAHFGEAILLAAELRKQRIDHLHNHFANSAATVGLLASKQAGLRWSFTIHGISEFDYPAGLSLASKIEQAAFVACVSYFGRAQAFRLLDSHQWSKLSVVRCGLELDELPLAQGDENQQLRLIAVGRLSAEKGIAGLLEALSLMHPEQRPALVIVGDGPMRDELDMMVERLGLRKLVTFLGRLPEPDTLAEIARNDVLVLPSFMEGLPIVLMEAMALGKPVVATRVAGIPELVTDGENGLLFTPSHWSELANKLSILVSDQGLRQRLGRSGPQRIAREFDVKSSAVQLRDLFHRHVLSSAKLSEHPSEQF